MFKGTSFSARADSEVPDGLPCLDLRCKAIFRCLQMLHHETVPFVMMQQLLAVNFTRKQILKTSNTA